MTPPDFEVGVMDALRKQNVEVREAEFFAHGTTVFINALRYDGQEHTVRIVLPAGKVDQEALPQIIKRFHENYEKEYTYRLGNEVQLVSYRLVAFGHVDQPALERLPDSTKGAGQALKGHREVDFDARGTHRATIWDRQQLRPGDSFEGPAIVEEPASTTVVFPGQSVEVDGHGNLHVQVRHGA